VLVENYIKTVHEFHNKQKALRLRRNLDSQKFFRLSKSLKGTDAVQKSLPLTKSPTQTKEKESETSNLIKKEQKRNTNYLDTFEDVEGDHSDAADHGLSAEELKMFKDEGIRMYDEMNSMSDEVK